MMRFGQPFAFLLLLPWLAALLWIYRRRRRRGLPLPTIGRLARRGPSWRARAANVLPLVSLAGLALCIVALARPRTVLSRIRQSSDAIAIQMCVDVSGSMEALDMSEIMGNRIVKERTRLDAVKDAFTEFIARRGGDLIGLVTFGGYASTRAPLTTDHAALAHTLRGVTVPGQVFDSNGQIVNQEELLTAIGDGLATACARLEHAEPTSRIVVLLSDGESNTGLIEPAQAIRLARKLGIKVYTIGVGTSGEAPFRGRDRFGREGVFYARVSMDERQLREIADQTGGRYFNVRDPRGLDEALKDIDRLEKTRIEQDLYSHYDEHFTRWLWPGLALLVAGAGLNMGIARRLI